MRNPLQIWVTLIIKFMPVFKDLIEIRKRINKVRQQFRISLFVTFNLK